MPVNKEVIDGFIRVAESIVPKVIELIKALVVRDLDKACEFCALIESSARYLQSEIKTGLQHTLSVIEEREKDAKESKSRRNSQ